MAFMGIFVFAWLLVFLLIIIGCIILFVFLPCLVLSIVALVNGITKKWPTWTKILLGITGTIVTIFVTLFIWYLVWRFGFYTPPDYHGSSSSEMVEQAYYVCQSFKYLIF